MNIEFANYQALYVLLALAGLFVAVSISKRAFSGISTTVFFLALLTLALIAAEPSLLERESTGDRTVLLDVSESVTPDEGELYLSTVKKIFGKEENISVFPFATRLAPIALELSEISSFQALRSSMNGLGTGGTDLEEALKGLRERGVSKMVLFSDGNETSGDVLEYASTNPGLRVHTYPDLKKRESSGVSFVRFSHPRRAELGQRVEAVTALRNSSRSEQTGTVTVYQDGEEIYSKQITLPANSETAVQTLSEPAKEGIQALEVVFDPSDVSLQSSRVRSLFTTTEREKVFLLSSSAQDARYLEQALKNESFKLTSLLGKKLPDSALEEGAVLILNNLPYAALGEAMSRRIKEYVNKGGGLVVIGGPQSFGLGGYIGSPLEETFPVKLLPPRTEEKRVNVGVQLVLDKSRSMAFGEKMNYAKEASREVIRNLKNEDYVGVIGFDSQPFVVVPLGPLSQIRDMALSRVARLFPAKSTNLYPALQDARRGLERIPAGRKHIIVLTDGKLPDGGPQYLELVKALRAAGTTLSTVMMGTEADVWLLKEMANIGGGAFYQTRDATALPKIFLADIKTSTGERSLKENERYRVRRGTSSLTLTSLTQYPELKGFVETEELPSASTELRVSGTDGEFPLLARKSFGDGVVVAFTSDANARWSSNWVPWRGYSQFWSEIIEAATSASEEAGRSIEYDFSYDVKGRELVIDLTVFEPLRSSLEIELTLPGGETLKPQVRSSDIGEYVVRAEIENPGDFQIVGSSGNDFLSKTAFYIDGSEFGERPQEATNTELLLSLSSLTGGVVNPDLKALEQEENQRIVRHDLSPYLLLATIAFLLLAIFLREPLGSSAEKLQV